MALETASYIHQLNASNPAGSDRLQQGDDHIRLVKSALKATFPNLTGPLTLDQDFLNRLKDLVTPTGLIGILYGETVPTGWAICNGQTVQKSDGTGAIVTPDLRGRVIVGVSDTHVYGSVWGQESYEVTSTTAGAHTHTATANSTGAHDHGGQTGSHTLTVDQVPAHSHSNGVADNLPNEIFVYGSRAVPTPTSHNPQTGSSAGNYQGATDSVGGGGGHQHTLEDAGSHTHTITVSDVADHSHKMTVSASQPSAAFHYILKI